MKKPSFLDSCLAVFLLDGTKAEGLLFFQILASLRLASPKYAAQTSRLETQEELMLQFKSKGWKAGELKKIQVGVQVQSLSAGRVSSCLKQVSPLL